MDDCSESNEDIAFISIEPFWKKIQLSFLMETTKAEAKGVENYTTKLKGLGTCPPFFPHKFTQKWLMIGGNSWMTWLDTTEAETGKV